VLVPGLGELLLAAVPLSVPAPAVAPGFYEALLEVPATPALLGAQLFAQGLFLDPTTPAEPLRLTNEAAEVSIGLD
jgi:hypothetical protein